MGNVKKKRLTDPEILKRKNRKENSSENDLNYMFILFFYLFWENGPNKNDQSIITTLSF